MASLSPPNYEWHETAPGRYERDVDEIEQFYTSLARAYSASGGSYMAITGHIRLSFRPVSRDASLTSGGFNTETELEVALQKAWTRIKYDYPGVASWVEYDCGRRRCKKVYQVGRAGSPVKVKHEESQSPDGSNRAPDLDPSFRIVRGGFLNGVQFANSSLPTEKSAMLYIIRPMPENMNEFTPETIIRRDVVFRCPHELIDGIGTLTLLGKLAEYSGDALAQRENFSMPAFGREFKNLSPPFRLAAGLSETTPQKVTEEFTSIASINNEAAKSAEFLSISSNSETDIPLPSQRTAITLSRSHTNAIIQKCKKVGISPTHAFHAGIVLALRNQQERGPDPKKGRYISYAIINLRKYCRPPFNTSAHAAADYHAVSPQNLVVDVEIPACPKSNGITKSPYQLKASEREENLEFQRITTQIKEFYTRSTATLAQNLDLIPPMLAAKTLPYAMIRPTTVPAPTRLPSVSLSSMGVVDMLICARYGDLAVSGPWVTGDELGSGLGAFLSTFYGRLEISVCWNEAFHEEGKIKLFIAELIELVGRRLGIDDL